MKEIVVILKDIKNVGILAPIYHTYIESATLTSAETR